MRKSYQSLLGHSIQRLLLVLMLCGSFPILFNAVAARSDTYIAGAVDEAALVGIDTIVVSVVPGPLYSLTVDRFNSKGTTLDEVVAQKVRDTFSTQKWIKVIAASESLKSDDLRKPNVVHMDFLLSAQSDMVRLPAASGTVATASLSMHLYYWDSKTTYKSIQLATNVTFPFILPQDREQLSNKLSSGVGYLTSYLPPYFYCANKELKAGSTCIQKFEPIDPWTPQTTPTHIITF